VIGGVYVMKRQISGDNKSKNCGRSRFSFPASAPVPSPSGWVHVCGVYKYQMESFQRDKFNWRQFVAKHMREKLPRTRKKEV